MTLSIFEVHNKSELKEWVLFPFRFYRDDPFYVPQIIREEIDFFSVDKNPGFDVADTKLLLARQNGKTVGRVCGILHRLEEEKLGYKRGRFGWFESIDDANAAQALLSYLEDWFVSQGCREFTGPHGFTDLDPEGLLVDGFDALPTIAGSYNKPYYQKLLEDFGFQKEVDYIEHRIEFPEDNPLFGKLQKRVNAAESDGYRVVKLRKKKDILQYVDQWWDVLEESFEHLFGVTPLTSEQKKYYTKKYFGFVDPKFMIMVADRKNRIQGLFLGLPSLSRPFQKAKGRLLPFGFLNILQGFKKFDTVDFYFAGIHPQANARKVFPVMVLAMYRTLKQHGVRYIETNRELETNISITGIWARYSVLNKRRTRIFKKLLTVPPMLG
jgi:hypothetical protein